MENRQVRTCAATQRVHTPWHQNFRPSVSHSELFRVLSFVRTTMSVLFR